MHQTVLNRAMNKNNDDEIKFNATNASPEQNITRKNCFTVMTAMFEVIGNSWMHPHSVIKIMICVPVQA